MRGEKTIRIGYVGCKKRNENRNGGDKRVSVNDQQGTTERVRTKSQKRNSK